MKPPSSVSVALSGGVDSAMAAILLKKTGWRVYGLHLILSDAGPRREARIRELADRIDVPLEIVDLRKRFEARVIAPFCDAYMKGWTPNPCIGCNPEIKFDALYHHCTDNGIDSLATGHYVRVDMEAGRPFLLRGLDTRKDQSYFLQRLSTESLSRAVFPLGKTTKQEIRERARDMNLPCHSRPESQEICFLSGMDYREFMEYRQGPDIRRKGDILSEEGGLLGRHDGVYRYTIGQRHGLGIASPRPYYVKEIRPGLNQVVVARREALFSSIVEARDVHWIQDPPAEDGFQSLAQVRYRHRAAPGRLTLLSKNEVKFRFDVPQWAITPGQALALYDGERLMGGGWISRSVR